MIVVVEGWKVLARLAIFFCQNRVNLQCQQFAGGSIWAGP